MQIRSDRQRSIRITTQGIFFIVTAISTAVDKAIPKSKSERSESNPISDETVALIKKKRRLRRQYSQIKDPTVKTRINQLQIQIKGTSEVFFVIS